MRGLKGKVAIVTGAAHPDGIGGAAARRLVEEGVHVYLTDVDDATGKAHAEALGAQYRHHDVSREEVLNSWPPAPLSQHQGKVCAQVCPKPHTPPRGKIPSPYNAPQEVQRWQGT